MPLNLGSIVPSGEALHSLAYQKGPNLCTELEKVFDDVLEYKKSLGDAPKSEKAKLVINYVKNTAGKKILQVIQTYTGLVMNLHLSKTFNFRFAVIWHFDKDIPQRVCDPGYVAIFLARLRYSGEISNEVFEKWVKKFEHAKSQKELEKMSRELMKDKAAVTAAMHDKYKLNTELYFDPYSAFLWDEIVPDTESITSKELAAVVAHECGHVISFVVHMIDLCYKKEILYNACKSYYKRADEETKRRVALSVIHKVFPEEGKKLSERLTNTKVKKDHALFANMMYTIGYLLLRIFENAYFIIFTCVDVVYKLAILNMFTQYDSYDPEKRSDFANEGRFRDYIDEEHADEYVSKMGYAQYLATGLAKVERLYRFRILGSGGYKNVSRLSFYSNLLPFMAMTFLVGYHEDYIHPDEYKRRENNMMDVIKAFKNSECPPELLDEYYKAFKLAKQMNDHRLFENKWEIANKGIRDLLRKLLETPQAMLFEGRFQSEYETLFRNANKLMNNQIYALSYGIGKKESK